MPETPSAPTDEPNMGDHFRPAVDDDADPAEAVVADGVYRVVGTPDGRVTLLRVGDADGQRVHSGRIVSVDSDAIDGFAPAENPDGNRSLGGTITSLGRSIYWSLRSFGGSLAANPIPAAAALAVLLIGRFGEELLGLSDGLQGVLIVVGALALAYVGSGRL
jgi:hypothetical protein